MTLALAAGLARPAHAGHGIAIKAQGLAFPFKDMEDRALGPRAAACRSEAEAQGLWRDMGQGAQRHVDAPHMGERLLIVNLLDEPQERAA